MGGFRAVCASCNPLKLGKEQESAVGATRLSPFCLSALVAVELEMSLMRLSSVIQHCSWLKVTWRGSENLCIANRVDKSQEQIAVGGSAVL